MEIASGLSVKEYALLIEGLNPNSPVQVQSSSVRHYPEQATASHVLGYVGSGYEADTKDLLGNDLTTFEIKGKERKSGIEKYFDDYLKGIEGSEIWRISPNGVDQIKTIFETYSINLGLGYPEGGRVLTKKCQESNIAYYLTPFGKDN